MDGESSSSSTNLKPEICFNVPESIDSNLDANPISSSTAPTPIVQAHCDNKGPSQNNQGNVNSPITQIVNIHNHQESAKTRSSDQVTENDEAGNSNLKPGIWFNIPEPIDSFCGRENFLSELHDNLQNQHHVNSQSTATTAVAGPSRPRPKPESTTPVTVLSQVKIVSGLGGIGKTETSIQYIWSHRKSYKNFIWINAESENSMRNSFTKLASQLQIPLKDSEEKSREIEEIVKKVYNKITEGGKTSFMVFDNAEDYKSCKDFFPLELHPDLKKLIVILATSRNQEWTSRTGKIQVIPLDVLTEDESLEFILKQLEIPEPDSPEFKEESKEFIQLIGGLPLALQQAVAYIRNEKDLQKFLGKSYEISDYVQEFKKRMMQLQKFPPNPESSVTVYVTWNVTLLKFFDLENGENAIKILTDISFLYADKIPLPFLRDVVPEIEQRKFSKALKLIEKYSLIKINVKESFLSIHRQLQFVILQYLNVEDSPECNDVSRVVTNLVEKCAVVLRNMKKTDKSAGDIFLNMDHLVNAPVHFSLIPVTEPLLDFTCSFAAKLNEAGRLLDSLKMYEKVLDNYQKQGVGVGAGRFFGKFVNVLNEMTGLLFQLGRADDALALLERTIDNKEFIPDSPEFAACDPLKFDIKCGVASVLSLLGKKEEAAKLYQQVLTYRTKIHGENHPLTLEIQHQMASLIPEDLLKALDLDMDVHKDVERNEAKMEIVLDEDHPQVLTLNHGKGQILLEAGNFEAAFKILNQVYEKRSQILGEDHPETIKTLMLIAETVENQEKNSEALELYKKAYQSQCQCRKTTLGLGQDDPVTFETKVKIAQVLRKMKQFDQSLKLLQEVHHQQISLHGEDHLKTLRIQSNIANAHLSQGELEKALELYENVEKVETQALGPSHPRTVSTKKMKALTLKKIGRLEEALKLYEQVYQQEKIFWGENHPQTTTTQEELKSVVSQMSTSNAIAESRTVTN